MSIERHLLFLPEVGLGPIQTSLKWGAAHSLGYPGSPSLSQTDRGDSKRSGLVPALSAGGANSARLFFAQALFVPSGQSDFVCRSAIPCALTRTEGSQRGRAVRGFWNGSDCLSAQHRADLQGVVEDRGRPVKHLQRGANHLAVRRALAGAGDCQAGWHQPPDGVALAAPGRGRARRGLLRDKSRPPGIPPAPRPRFMPSSSTSHANRPPW